MLVKFTIRPDLRVIIPGTTVTTVQHRHCNCGRVPAGSFSAGVLGPTFGRYRCTYSTVHLPVLQCAELLTDVLDVPVSAGWLNRLQLEAAHRLDPFMDDVRDHFGLAAVLYADETGTALSTRKYKYIQSRPTRERCWSHIRNEVLKCSPIWAS